MFHDFRFVLGIVTTPFTYHSMKCIFHTKNALFSKHYTILTQSLSLSMWNRHLRHWYVKYVVIILKLNLKS